MHWLKEGEDPLTVPLFSVDFWILIHDLPLGFMSETAARQLGDFVGNFIEYDGATIQLGYKRIVRVKVKVDVRKPLKRWKSLTLPSSEVVFVLFEYEKLTPFCFICGKLGHGKSFCPIRARNPQQEFVFRWDIPLRAQSRRNSAWQCKWLVEDDGGIGIMAIENCWGFPILCDEIKEILFLKSLFLKMRSQPPLDHVVLYCVAT